MDSTISFDVNALSRRELQFLSKELQIAKGNAKSEVMIEALEDYIAKSGAQFAIDTLEMMPEEMKVRTPHGNRTPRSTRNTPRAIPFNNEEIATPVLTLDKRVTDATPDPNSFVTPLRRSSRTTRNTPMQHETVTPLARRSLLNTKTPTNQDVEKLSSTDEEKKMSLSSQQLDFKDRENAESNSANGGNDESTLQYVEERISDLHVTPKRENSNNEIKENKLSNSARSVQEIEPEPCNTVDLLVKENNQNENESSKKKCANGRIRTEKEEVDELVRSNPELSYAAFGKINCSVTGHDIVASKAAIEDHLRGKRYALKKKLADDYKEFEPMIIEHPEFETHLLCQVTGAVLPKDRTQIQMHQEGIKYRKSLPEWTRKYEDESVKPED